MNMNYTPLQKSFREQVERREAFTQWCDVKGLDHESRRPGPIVFLWYQKDNLHACRVGQNKILREEFDCVDTVTGRIVRKKPIIPFQNLSPLPNADCSHCYYDDLPKDGGHCYMFKEHPGEKCGQFKKKV